MRSNAVASCMLLASLFNGLAQPTASADVWLSAIDPVVQKEQKHNDTPKDYMDFFGPTRHGRRPGTLTSVVVQTVGVERR